jgi:hypothetical protein
MDNFMTIGLFYLMLTPLPDRNALDLHWQKRREQNPQLLGFWRRVLQVHLCFIYFFGGVSKCLGAGWWNGSSIWRALARPPYNVISPDVLIQWRHLFPFVSISVCILETAYVLFIWPKQTRWIWLTGILIMHLAIGLSMGLYLFALIMITLNLAAFGPPLRWRHNVAVGGPTEKASA